MTIDQYIKAIQNQAGSAKYVQLRENGKLTPPMTISAAAEYLYNGTKPESRTMASESNKMYSDPDIKRINEQAKARESNTQMRNFYEHGVLPALTFGASELFTNGDPRTMSLATTGAIGTRMASRGFWPLALGLGVLNWYTATHQPPSMSLSFDRSFEVASDDTPVEPDTVSSATPATGNVTGGSAPASPEPERNDSTPNRLSRLLWETQKNSPKSSRIGRNLRNFGLRVPIYGTVANWGIPTIGNTVSFINTGKSPIKWPLTSYIPGVFDTDSNTNQPKKLVPVQVNGQVYYVDLSQNTLTTTQQVDTAKAVTTNQLPDTTITNQGDDFEQWLKSRQTE